MRAFLNALGLQAACLAVAGIPRVLFDQGGMAGQLLGYFAINVILSMGAISATKPERGPH